MKYIDAEKLNADLDRWVEAMADAEGDYSDGVRFALRHFRFLLASLQQEQPKVDLEKAARHVYESWMGGTMDDVAGIWLNSARFLTQERRKTNERRIPYIS